MTTGRLKIVGIRTGLEDPKATLAELQGFVRTRGGWVQLVDADHVAGRDHILSAVAHARRSIDRGLASSGRFELEVLLYLSGERQISKAIEAAGVRPGRPFIMIIGDGPDEEEILNRFSWTADDSLIDSTSRKLRTLGFSKADIGAAGDPADLPLERVARVDLLK